MKGRVRCNIDSFKIIMGNCAKYTTVGKEGKMQSVVPSERFNQQPADTESLANKPLPTLDIRPLLRKVKIKNSPQKRIGVRFLIGGADEILLPEKAVDEVNSAKWELEENFQYFLTEYELRKRFLLIELLSGGVTIATLKINMYLINIGPYHQDFQFPLNIPNRPRISFDFKMSQVVSMKIETQSLEIFQMKEHVGEEYAFSLKTIFGNNPKVSSLSSIYKIEHEQPDESLANAAWDNSKSPLPSISGSVPFYEFHYATLKYIFYKIDKLNQKQSEKPIAECFISFVKLLGFDSLNVVTRDKVQYEVKCIKLEEKLWSGGKQCGRVKLSINFEIQKHLKQMLVCVRTENGIAKMSPVYHSGNVGSRKQINKQITELEQISEKLMNEEGELEKKRNKLLKNGEQIGSMTGLTKESYKIIEKCLQSQVRVLEKSTKESVKIYEYANEEELLKGQNFLLKVGERQLRYINQGGQESLEDLKWRVLRALVERGQFTLNYMGFDISDRNTNKEAGYLSRKKALGLKFQDFNYRLLELTLKTLGIKAANEQKKFAETFCAISYIRIPQFRERLLSLIDKADDPEIDEWRGTDFSLKNKNTDFKTYLPGENTFEILFNWNKYFYEYIKNEPDYAVNLRELDHALKNKEWEARISRRRGAFFAFIREWVGFVTKVSVRIVHSNWKHFPGYIQIIKSLMAEMKIRQVSEYPSSIKMACNSLLSNENLLNTFVTIIFNKTSVNNNFDVIKILDLTNGFFQAIRKQNKRIPSTFNYRFFYNGIKLVIENLYSYSTAKALHLLYEHFDFFAYDFRIQLCNYLLGRLFFKLFLHWSFNVRVIFHHLLIVKVYKFFTNQLKADNLDAETRFAIRNISGRYSELLIILENVKKIKSKRFVPSTQNELYKKLRNNLRKKRKIMRKGEDQNMMEQQMLDQIPDTNLNQKTGQRAREETARIMSELARPQLERYDSQVLSKDIKIALAQTPVKQKDEVIRKKVTHVPSQFLTSTQDLGESEQFQKKKAPVSMNTAEEIQMPVLSQEDMKYVSPAMSEFSTTSNGYLQNLKKNKGDPSLKMEIMLDSGEMKPQQFNDVQQW